MKVIRKKDQMRREMEKLRKRGKIIGFVPTMGYLHDGHIKLIKEARKQTDVVVVSIFVNPIQFGPNEDYERYPRDEKRDLRICRNENVDFVFIPDARQMYPEDFETFVDLTGAPAHLCGLSRPGHFRGVATVLVKLFNIIRPHAAFFGLKDFQQTVVVRKLVRDLDFDLKVKLVETVRDKDGLAMSSRNTYLSEEERRTAVFIPRSLLLAKRMIDEGERDADKIKSTAKDFLEKNGVKVDYFEIADANSLTELKDVRRPCVIAVAGFVGKTRLIDNIVIDEKRVYNMPREVKL